MLIEARGAVMSIALPMPASANSSPWHFFGYFMDHRAEDLGWLWTHAWLSVVPVMVGLLIALPLGWLCGATAGSTRR